MGVWAGVSAVVRVPISKPRPRSVAPSCGGVTERTAPNPPTVPAAISRKRFMLDLGSFYSEWKANASSWNLFFGTPKFSAASRTAVTSGAGPQM